MKNLIKYRVPILFGSALVLFVCGLMLMENIMTSLNEGLNEPVTTIVSTDEKEEKTVNTKETNEESLLSPVAESVSVVRHFYHASDDSDRQKVSMDYFEGVYRPSLGIDFAVANGNFDVLASLSGTVKEVKTDPLFGQCVTIECADGWLLIYQSLSKVSVETGKAVKQGDLIGISGENVYEADLGNHVHFVLEKDGIQYDAENNFNKKLSEIK